MFFYFLQIHASDTDNTAFAEELINGKFDAQASKEGDNPALIAYYLSQFSKEEMPLVFKLAEELSQKCKLTIQDISNILSDLHDAPEETRKAMIDSSERIVRLAHGLVLSSDHKPLDVYSLFQELEKIPHEKIKDVVYHINILSPHQNLNSDWVESLIKIFASLDARKIDELSSFMHTLSQKSGRVQKPFMLSQIAILIQNSDDKNVFYLVQKLIDYSAFHTGDDYLNNFYFLSSNLYFVDKAQRGKVVDKVIEEMKNREGKISLEDLKNLIFTTEMELRKQ